MKNRGRGKLPCTINGIEYESVGEVEKALGINPLYDSTPSAFSKLSRLHIGTLSKGGSKDF